MLRSASLLICLSVFAATAQAKTVSLLCQGKEQWMGDENNKGPLSVEVSSEGTLAVKWVDSNQFLENEGIVCGESLPANMSCSTKLSANESAFQLSHTCGARLASRKGRGEYSYNSILVMNGARTQGEFSCASRTGADFQIALSDCK